VADTPATAVPAARGQRRELAEGDGLTRYPPGAPFPLRFDSRREWDGWRSRVDGDAVRATFPGTPVQVEGEWYEVMRAEVVAGRFVYFLAPWDDSFPLREPRELSPEACRQEHARQREKVQRQHASTLLTLASPFVGLLPAADQERLERELGLPAVRTTLVSALVFGFVALLLAGPGLAVTFVSRFAAANPGLAWMGTVLPLSLVVLVDSLVRVMHAVGGSAAGSVPVVFALAFWRQLRATGPLKRRRLPAGALAGVRDEVRRLPGTRTEGAGFEVVSRLGKPHWTLNVTPIRYAGAFWAAVERDEREVGGEMRHRFVLRPYDAETLRAAPVDYAPEEVEELHRREVVADRQMWVGIGGALWGLLDGGRQQALAALFDFEPAAQTRHSTTLGLVFGGIGATLALAYLVSGGGRAMDWMMLLACGAVIAESLARRRRLDRGVVSGSVLGVPLRPFAWLLRRGLPQPNLQ
jgi:hypothetical protein